MGVRVGTRVSQNTWISMPWWMILLLLPILVPIWLLIGVAKLLAFLGR